MIEIRRRILRKIFARLNGMAETDFPRRAREELQADRNLLSGKQGAPDGCPSETWTKPGNTLSGA